MAPRSSRVAQRTDCRSPPPTLCLPTPLLPLPLTLPLASTATAELDARLLLPLLSQLTLSAFRLRNNACSLALAPTPHLCSFLNKGCYVLIAFSFLTTYCHQLQHITLLKKIITKILMPSELSIESASKHASS